MDHLSQVIHENYCFKPSSDCRICTSCCRAHTAKRNLSLEILKAKLTSSITGTYGRNQVVDTRYPIESLGAVYIWVVELWNFLIELTFYRNLITLKKLNYLINCPQCLNISFVWDNRRYSVNSWVGVAMYMTYGFKAWNLGALWLLV